MGVPTQIPQQGASRRDTIISDHIIENLAVEVDNLETGEVAFNKEHIFIPSVVIVNVLTPTAPNVNLYLTDVRNVGQFATGSLTLKMNAGGIDTTKSLLNENAFSLIDKDSVGQTFTFNNVDSNLYDGNVGILYESTLEGIVQSLKLSINNVFPLQITAGTITLKDPSDVNSDCTLTLLQDITGSTGNVTIDSSGVSEMTSTGFLNGNNYGKVSFASSHEFSGSVRLRAVSLQNEYLM